MVHEQLAAHQEEGEVVHTPEEQEEAGRVQETVADGCMSSVSMSFNRSSNRRLTFRQRLDVTTARDQVREHDARVERDADDARPPANDVTDEVDLLLALSLRPEADTADEEGPVDGAAGVGVRSGETSVVLQH